MIKVRPEDLYRKLYVSSFVDIVTWWFEHSCSESPEKVVSYFEKFCGKEGIFS